MWTRLTRTSVTPLRKHPKRLSHAGIEITIFHVGMQSVNPSIEPFCSLLRETTQVWLLQLCLPSLIGSGEIDGPRQFDSWVRADFYRSVQPLYLSRGKTGQIAHVSSPFSGIAQKIILARETVEATCGLGIRCWY